MQVKGSINPHLWEQYKMFEKPQSDINNTGTVLISNGSVWLADQARYEICVHVNFNVNYAFSLCFNKIM